MPTIGSQGATAQARRRRLGQALADMLPGAATVRVSQHAPGRTWPCPFARAYGADGALLPLNRSLQRTVARWIMRAAPDAAWDEPQDFDLATGTLRRTVDGSS